jgi:hypothetical protein
MVVEFYREVSNTEIKSKEKKITPIVQESEHIIKPIVEFKPQSNEPKENVNDYEKKWQEKNKDLLDRKKREEMALEGLDEKEKQKRMIDKRIIDDASDFLASERVSSQTSLLAKS